MPCAYSRHPGLWRAELWGRIHSGCHRSAGSAEIVRQTVANIWLPCWFTDHYLGHIGGYRPRSRHFSSQNHSSRPLFSKVTPGIIRAKSAMTLCMINNDTNSHEGYFCPPDTFAPWRQGRGYLEGTFALQIPSVSYTHLTLPTKRIV